MRYETGDEDTATICCDRYSCSRLNPGRDPLAGHGRASASSAAPQ